MSSLQQPEIVNRPDFKLAGLKLRTGNEQDEIKELWRQFGERAEELRGVAETLDAYGAIDNFDEEKGEFDYLASVMLRDGEEAPEGMEVWQVLAQNYAVFPTSLATLMDTIDAIYGSWMPGSNYRRAPGPEFELYGEAFDPADSDSTFHLYIPVEPLAGGE